MPRCAACELECPLAAFSAMQRKKAELARCKRCLRDGPAETMRRHALAAEPHVTWAAQLVSCVREVPSRAQLFAAADGNSDADWRWARGTRGLGNQSPTAGLMPPSDSEESDSEESDSEESEADALGEAMALLQHDLSLASRGAPSPQGAAWGEAAGCSLLERGSVNRGEDGSEAAAAAKPSLYVCALSSFSVRVSIRICRAVSRDYG